MKVLVTADLHLTDRPQDEYRFGIFPWLAKQAKKHHCSEIIILGDLTDKKDRHSALLVAKVVAGIETVRDAKDLTVLMGNHDFVDPTNPFFEFVNHLDCVKFVTDVYEDGHTSYIPYQTTQAEFDEACEGIEEGIGVFIHQCVTGAISDTGKRLTGFSTAALEAKRPKWCFAGDIHRPQTVGCVTYVGSPYHTRFGDPYLPRVLLLDTETGETQDLHFKAPHKVNLVINSAAELKACPVIAGDHVKIDVELIREERVNWPRHKKQIRDTCTKLGLEVYGLRLLPNDTKSGKTANLQSDGDVFEAFCKHENLPSQVRLAGKALMEVNHEDEQVGTE